MFLTLQCASIPFWNLALVWPSLHLLEPHSCCYFTHSKDRGWRSFFGEFLFRRAFLLMSSVARWVSILLCSVAWRHNNGGMNVSAVGFLKEEFCIVNAVLAPVARALQKKKRKARYHSAFWARVRAGTSRGGSVSCPRRGWRSVAPFESRLEWRLGCNILPQVSFCFMQNKT